MLDDRLHLPGLGPSKHHGQGVPGVGRKRLDDPHQLALAIGQGRQGPLARIHAVHHRGLRREESNPCATGLPWGRALDRIAPATAASETVGKTTYRKRSGGRTSAGERRRGKRKSREVKSKGRTDSTPRLRAGDVNISEEGRASP